MSSQTNKTRAEKYWRANVRLIGILLAIWAIVAYCLSILFVEPLNNFQLFDLPLGFWIANQGSMYVFVILILVYAVVMDRIDKKLKDESQT